MTCLELEVALRDVDADLIREVVFADNREVHDQFRAEFGPAIEEFIEDIDRAYQRFLELGRRAPRTARSGWVQAFLYSAFDSLIVSVHFLVSGHLIHSGNAMRQFGESVAMALLCSHKRTEVFERFTNDPTNFPTHKAIDMVGQKRRKQLLDVDSEGWETFKRITSFYDQYSHVSALGVATRHMLETDQAVILGGAYDPAKREMYELELTRRTSAVAPFVELIIRVEQMLAESA